MIDNKSNMKIMQAIITSAICSRFQLILKLNWEANAQITMSMTQSQNLKSNGNNNNNCLWHYLNN